MSTAVLEQNRHVIQPLFLDFLVTESMRLNSAHTLEIVIQLSEEVKPEDNLYTHALSS